MKLALYVIAGAVIFSILMMQYREGAAKFGDYVSLTILWIMVGTNAVIYILGERLFLDDRNSMQQRLADEAEKRKYRAKPIRIV